MPKLHDKFLKPYDPVATEPAVYERWRASGLFNPDTCVKEGVTAPDAEVFSMMLPPPNVTGMLHIGHASMLTIEDILARYNRMRGKRTLWLPGTDHAAIATQSKVEKEIQKTEKKSRHDLGREELLRRVEAFAKASHDTIVQQVARMGASVDWSREAFTLDEARNLAVRTAFKRMYDAGLIIRKNRVVNWDPKGQTTISDDEIVYEERTAKVYTFRYAKDFPIPIATTRPETKVGDTAVAVHPDDERYRAYVGKEYDVVFCGVPLHIKVVADKDVDPAFGTGAVGVTPAHSMVDYEIGERHGLPLVQVINEYARMMVDAPELKDKKVLEARDIIVSWLEGEGLMQKVEEAVQNVSTAERTGAVIEPLPKLQWFVDVNKAFRMGPSKLKGVPEESEVTLKTLMRTVVESGQVEILPDRFAKTYFHWIDNLKPWCISRQIWYGHRVPVWYCAKREQCAVRSEECAVGSEKCGEPIVSVEPVANCPHCGGAVEQDHDTLDTWFSSGLWTFSTLGWPNDAPDFRMYHPTTVLETAYDILFFWVARMILMSTYLLGDVPFKYVYIQGLVRDEKGRKISKSLGNNVDPIDLAEKYGADALRMALIVGAPPGNDANIGEEKIKAYKKFANKLWNVSRYVITSCQDFDTASVPALTDADAARVAEMHALIADVTADLDAFRLYLAAEKLYHYTWHTFADVIIEETKTRVNGDDEADKRSARYMLWTLLMAQLKLLHPFMPFVTEEIWSLLPEQGRDILMTERWPQALTK